jgi:hypothetical protein
LKTLNAATKLKEIFARIDAISRTPLNLREIQIQRQSSGVGVVASTHALESHSRDEESNLAGN